MIKIKKFYNQEIFERKCSQCFTEFEFEGSDTGSISYTQVVSSVYGLVINKRYITFPVCGNVVYV